MIQLLPKIALCEQWPLKIDREAKTALELNAMTYGKMNELIEDYNKFIDDINAKIDEFMNDQNADRELFEIGLRQEFQDFIDVVELKYSSLDGRLDAKVREVNAAVDAAIAEMEAAKNAFIAELENAQIDLLNAEY